MIIKMSTTKYFKAPFMWSYYQSALIILNYLLYYGFADMTGLLSCAWCVVAADMCLYCRVVDSVWLRYTRVNNSMDYPREDASVIFVSVLLVSILINISYVLINRVCAMLFTTPGFGSNYITRFAVANAKAPSIDN